MDTEELLSNVFQSLFSMDELESDCLRTSEAILKLFAELALNMEFIFKWEETVFKINHYMLWQNSFFSCLFSSILTILVTSYGESDRIYVCIYILPYISEKFCLLE